MSNSKKKKPNKKQSDISIYKDVGMESGSATMENSMSVLPEVKHSYYVT